MKTLNISKNLAVLIFSGFLGLYLSGCGDNVTEPENMTDDQFLTQLVTTKMNSSRDEDDNLMVNESYDLDDGGAVADEGGDTHIDSLIKWGRKILNVNVSINITSEGDSIKNVFVTRTINGNFIIIGIISGNQDTVVKPYTEVLKRNAVFKRIDRRPNPRYNWRLYKVSMVDGGSTQPQVGSDYVEMNKVEVYVNNVLKYTFMGPDFTQNVFTTRRFNGAGIPEVHLGDQVRIKVYTFSKQSEPDIVAWHWARNAFGFHRVPFVMTSQTPNGQYWDRTYEKTYQIYYGHVWGSFNGYISASTHKSLYDDSAVEFASDLIGTPYRVLP